MRIFITLLFTLFLTLVVSASDNKPQGLTWSQVAAGHRASTSVGSGQVRQDKQKEKSKSVELSTPEKKGINTVVSHSPPSQAPHAPSLSGSSASGAGEWQVATGNKKEAKAEQPARQKWPVGSLVIVRSRAWEDDGAQNGRPGKAPHPAIVVGYQGHKVVLRRMSHNLEKWAAKAIPARSVLPDRLKKLVDADTFIEIGDSSDKLVDMDSKFIRKPRNEDFMMTKEEFDVFFQKCKAAGEDGQKGGHQK